MGFPVSTPGEIQAKGLPSEQMSNPVAVQMKAKHV